MAEVFNREEIDNKLPGLIMCSHGPLAVAMTETLRMLTGDTVNIAAFSLEEGEKAEEYREKIGEAINAFPEGSLVCVDVLGGTPSNSVMMYARQSSKKVYCVSGLNLPIMMQAELSREYMSGEELLNSVLEIENGGVTSITALLGNMLSK